MVTGRVTAEKDFQQSCRLHSGPFPAPVSVKSALFVSAAFCVAVD